jgi:methylenetetrahydrofolate dehydrogenase (NADP+)/methenyltetrahydrofolate cyclohydrolase
MAVILDGKTLSAQIRASLKAKVEAGVATGKPLPHLTAMQVGDDQASTVYIRAKEKACEELGFGFRHYKLPANTTMDQLRRAVREVNDDPGIHGFIVQSPLPPHLNEIEVQRLVSPAKDVDCFHPENVGLLYIGQPRFQPCTAAGVVELILAYGFDTAGKRVVIVGRSVIVGRPLAVMMMLKGRGGDSTVTVCHSRTKDLAAVCREADILIPAIGKTELIRGDWVKEGAIVVDVGINRVPDASKKQGYKLLGDVAYAEVEPKCAAIAPVPGGVGPMTVAILMSNVMRAAGYTI